jgi:arylsulfatase A-like enzyme
LAAGEAAALTAFSGSDGYIAVMSKRPNIVVTIADDQRYDTLGCLGLEPIRTPFLDRLAERGTCFTNAYLPGSNHGAVCAPSRAQLHTGRSLFHTNDALCRPDEARLDRQREKRDDPLPTLGQRLRDAGYATCGVGKWHNEEASFVRSFEHGRRVMFGGMSSHYCVPNVSYEPDTAGEQQHQSNAGHSTDIFSGAAVQFLEEYDKRNDDQPFFLYVAYTAPHDPRETVWHWQNQYRAQDMPLPPSFASECPLLLGGSRGRDEMLAEFPRTPEEIQQHLADYAAITSHMDEGIGRIHDTLDRLGLTDNTIVAHTADHGIAIGRHGLMGKQSVYDHSIHMPLLMAGPSVEAGRRDDRLCYMQDLHPTLLAAAGVELEAEATDFHRLDESPRRTTIGNLYGRQQRTVRDATYKLNRTIQPGGMVTQLFNLEEDRHETRDLADDPGHASIASDLGQALEAWQAEMDDPCREDFA